MRLSDFFAVMSKDSLIAAALKRFGVFWGGLCKGSLVFRLASRNGRFAGFLGRSWVYKLLSSLFHLPVKLLSPIILNNKSCCDSSLFFRLAVQFLDSLHIWTALFLALAMAVPHSGWSNSYSAAAALLLLLGLVARMVLRAAVKPLLLALDVFLVIFILSVVISTFFSVSPSESSRFLIFYATCFIFFIVLALSIETKKQLAEAIGFTLLGLTLCALYGVWQGIVGVPVDVSQIDTALNEGVKGRIWSTFDNPNNFAEVLILFLPFYLSSALNAKKLPVKLIWLAVSVPALFSLLLTQSRADWLGLAVGIGVFVFFKNKRLIPLLLILAILSVPFIPAGIIKRAVSIFNFQDSSNKTRLQIYQSIFPMFKDYWFTGLGLGNDIFKRIVQNYNLFSKMIPAHSHNLFLQVWLETGVIGFLSFTGFLLRLVKRSIKAVTKPKDKELTNTIIAALSGLAAVSVAGMADYIWFNPRVMLLFWSVAGLLTCALKLSCGNTELSDSGMRVVEGGEAANA